MTSHVHEPEIERRLERFKTAARAADVKLTHQRLEIFREVASSVEHPDAEVVFRAVQARMPTVSLDTVYRTLWMLSDLGLITTVGPRRDRVRFDANLEQHHHYICVRCGLTRDFVSPALDALPIPGAVKRLGSVLATHVEVRGTCGSCANGKPEEPPTKNRKKPGGKRRSAP